MASRYRPASRTTRHLGLRLRRHPAPLVRVQRVHEAGWQGRTCLANPPVRHAIPAPEPFPSDLNAWLI